MRLSESRKLNAFTGSARPTMKLPPGPHPERGPRVRDRSILAGDAGAQDGSESNGPATREPGDPVRAEAIELLACLASQPGEWRYETMGLPGGWSIAARNYARLKLPDNLGPVAASTDAWREFYAEAEARLRLRPTMSGACPVRAPAPEEHW